MKDREQVKATERNVGMFMYINLMKQAHEWVGVFKDSKEKFSREIKYTYKKNKKLIELIESNLGEENLEKFNDDSEIFSRTLELIRKAETPAKKEELYLIMKEYTNGTLKIIESND